MEKTKKLFKVLCVIFIAIATLTLTGCGKSKDESKGLVGSWEHSSYVYKFNEDKSGAYIIGTTEMPFTYEDKGDKVSIKYENSTVPSEFEYRIEGNKLIIKDSFGKDVEYIKK